MIMEYKNHLWENRSDVECVWAERTFMLCVYFSNFFRTHHDISPSLSRPQNFDWSFPFFAWHKNLPELQHPTSIASILLCLLPFLHDDFRRHPFLLFRRLLFASSMSWETDRMINQENKDIKNREEAKSKKSCQVTHNCEWVRGPTHRRRAIHCECWLFTPLSSPIDGDWGCQVSEKAHSIEWDLCYFCCHWWFLS